jgi:hypothetical protein
MKRQELYAAILHVIAIKYFGGEYEKLGVYFAVLALSICVTQEGSPPPSP